MASAPQPYLVPGRSCGACVACCTDLAITADGFDKPAGVACVNCMPGGGCAIYADRPQTCRSYHCVWRSMPALDESWRPDLSGVLIVWSTPPAGGQATHAVDLILTGDVEIIVSDRFIGLATGFIAQGVATFLGLPRGPDFLSTNACLNDLLAPSIAARDREQARALMRAAYGEMMSRPARPVTAEHKQTNLAS